MLVRVIIIRNLGMESTPSEVVWFHQNNLAYFSNCKYFNHKLSCLIIHSPIKSEKIGY